MTIHEKIKEEVKEAMKAKDEIKLRTVRSILTAFTNELVATDRKPQDVLPDEDAMKVIKRLAKQRKDSIEQYEKGGRDDLVKVEQEELEVLEDYLPEQMSKEEIKKVVEKKMEELGVSDKSGMGQLMGAVMGELGNKADGGDVKEVVEELLS